MQRKNLLILAIILLLGLVPVVRARAGGWTVVTLTYLPGGIRAETPFKIEFAVRDHGQILGAGHTPTVYFYQAPGKDPLRFLAHETQRAGYYTAEINLPDHGNWIWSISPYNAPDIAQSMPNLDVRPAAAFSEGKTLFNFHISAVATALGGLLVAGSAGLYFVKTRKKIGLGISLIGIMLILLAGTSLPRSSPRPALAAQNVLETYNGQDLFVAKGCVVCHVHDRGRQGYSGVQSNIGPNLSELNLPADYLSAWLSNPPALKPKTRMPNLDLAQDEIEALVAFLTAP